MATPNAMTASLTTTIQSPAPVGTIVTFAASVSGASEANLWYRFRERRQGGTYQIIRDFSPVSALDWTASKHDGTYEIEVSVRDLETGGESSATSLFQFQSRVVDGGPVVSPTANSLVFQYSAPECPADSRMKVEFRAADGALQATPYEACTRGSSMNFYLAGLRSNTRYTASYTVDTGSSFLSGPAVDFVTGGPPADLFTDAVLIPGNPAADPVLVGGPLAANPVAYDLAGNVVWYGPAGGTFLTRVEAGGYFWSIVEVPGADSSQQVVRKFDLAGITVLETNAARVSEQLTAMGRRAITAFHHEARPIAGGRVAVLAGVEQVVTDVQGPGPVDVLGDMIVVLDRALNVVWAWDTFDNLDVQRAALLGEVCPGSGCPPFYLAAAANDWTHGNALQETTDGNLLYSTRNQDWLIKISYDGGNGDGHIIWRLGQDGDFQIDSSDPFPWFSHQHDGNFEAGDSSRLMVFDDGNTRVSKFNGGNSRGQVFSVDETNRTVTPLLNVDLGVYSAAVGSAQRLRNGDYHFDAGFVQENGTIDSYSFEANPAGSIVYEARQDAILYRTFRLASLYTPN